MNRKSHFSLVTLGLVGLCLLAGIQCSTSQKATIQERVETIKTYPFSDPDPMPMFARSTLWGRGSRLYPYFFFDTLSTTAVDKEWKVVHLENPYIALSVLPQVGGKIWGATEKSSNREFIYTNHVMKFREIALRGPWTSGGIEFNFGIVGHTPSTATPVDYLVRKNRDGSVSCIVGTMDLPSRTRWSVTITLPKDKAFLETKALWYNPSPLNQSYYVWMTGATKTEDDLQYIFPGRYSIGHSYAVPLEPWPVDGSGSDLSWYKNNNFGSSKSYFVVGDYEHFFGGYWHDAGFGYGHWALYDDIPGKKVWIWAQSRSGAIWEDLLTDSDGQYTEPQAGRLLNQSDHEFFGPYRADTWREIWFSYRKIGLMDSASPYGILHVDQRDASLSVGIFALQKIDDDLVVEQDGEEIYREHLTLMPTEVYEKEVPAPAGKALLHVHLDEKLDYTNDPRANDLNRPIHFHSFDESTAEGLFLAASRLEKERNYDEALGKYMLCLEKEPLHTRALCRVAELYFRRGEDEKALSFAGRALENVMYDPEANYLYGIISRRLGNLVDAKETLGWAARSMEYRSAAYCQMAEIYLLEQNLELALEYTGRSLEFNTKNINAYQVMAATYRKLKQPKKAQQVLEKLEQIDPLNHQARFEQYLLNPDRRNLRHFQSMIRNEFPEETYIEIAVYYLKLGLIPEAKQLFEFAADHPTSCYWLAFLLKEKDPEKSQSLLKKAGTLSPLQVFPFREESIPVFDWASKAASADWKAKYYKALIYWSRGRVEEAQELLRQCEQADFAPFYLTRAQGYKQSNPEKALEDLERAVQIDEKSWKTWHFLIGYYLELGLVEKALASSRDAAQRFPDSIPIRIDMVRALMSNGYNQEAAAILDRTTALPSEGATGLHGLFVRCQVNLALENMKKGAFSEALQHLEKSRTFPENLGTGEPYSPDLRMQEYLMVLCLERVGEKERAAEVRKGIYEYTLEHLGERGPNQYIGGLVLKHFGAQQKAAELLKGEKPPKEILEIIQSLSR